MRYTELLEALQQRTGYAVLCGDAQTTVERSLVGNHPDPLLGEIVAMLYQWCALTTVDAPVQRAALVNALGPLRRRYMAGEGDARDFLRLSRVIEAIDAAFDAELQMQRRG
jgi:hypothetical protein